VAVSGRALGKVGVVGWVVALSVAVVVVRSWVAVEAPGQIDPAPWGILGSCSSATELPRVGALGLERGTAQEGSPSAVGIRTGSSRGRLRR
jgi:hypothetical protein